MARNRRSIFRRDVDGKIRVAAGSVFENHFSKRDISAVCDCEGDVFHAQPIGDFVSQRLLDASVGLPLAFSYHFDVSPTHAAPPACSQRLHRRFFGGKTSRIAFEFVLVALAVCHFARCVQAFENGRAVAQ